MNRNIKVWHLVLMAALLGAALLKAQSVPPISLISAPTGGTLTSCGTPTLPSICVVATGVYVWQSTTTGWFLLQPSVAAGVSSLTVCNAAGASCGTAQTGVVTVNIPTKVTVTAPTTTGVLTTTAPAASLQ